MRRCKPHQQLYTPGSGPLRKSGQGVEENDFHVNLDPQMNDQSSNSKFNRRKTENSSFKNNNSENVNITNQSDMGDPRRRNKKPEQPIYVPKPVAQAMAERETFHHPSINELNTVKSMPNTTTNTDRDVDHRINKRPDHRNGNHILHHNGSTERLNLNSYSKSKRFSSNRKHGNEFSDHYPEENRHLTPVVEQQQQRHYGGNRDARQASEPRVMGPPSHSRVRDTRSVEPVGKHLPNHNYQNDNKIQAKPPSGRRHSTCLETGKSLKSFPNFESLAPRFQRKYFLENNIDPAVLEDQCKWDGSSVEFRGSENSQQYSLPSTYYHPPPNYHPNVNKSSYPVPSYMTTPLPDQPPQSWSSTFPNTRVRGRGRLRPETADNSHYGSQVLRSLTPDRIMLLSPCNSRPCTPPPFTQKNRSIENISVNSDRCQTPPASGRVSNAGVSDNEAKVSTTHAQHGTPRTDTSKSSPSGSQSSNSLKNQATIVREESDDILDWSEEVELNEKLEALSDSMTRCSSVASLADNGSHPPSTHKSRKSKRNRGNRNRSSSRHRRDKSTENQNIQTKKTVSHDIDRNHNKQNRRTNKHTSEELGYSQEKLTDNDAFKVPDSRNRRRKNSFRDKSNERRRDRRPSYNDNSRHSSLDRSRRESYNEVENWRDEIRLRSGSEKKETPTDTKKIETADRKMESKSQAPGIIVLPQPQVDRSKPPILHLPESQPRSQRVRTISGPQRTLFDPNNPNKPIIVTASSSRALNSNEQTQADIQHGVEVGGTVHTDQFGNRPAWYSSENAQNCHYQQHLLDVRKADLEMQFIVNSGLLLPSWTTGVPMLRKFFKESLEFLLAKDIKFCQTENVENHYWKILYYNIIEIMRKAITSDPENKDQYKSIILSLIDEGTKYFEKVLEMLEDIYKFKLDNFLGINNMPPWKGLGFIGLALVSAQKIFLFLGDLARYKEQVNDTTNYGKCRQWYIKAQEINPKNGRPYNQLALLAVYARRKLEAVYYYMRSLMVSNPVQSAKESLISLFDENRKKYEQSERKRREEKAKLQMKEKESTQTVPGSLRREIWIHPDGGRRLHRTTSAAHDNLLDSEEEDLLSLTSVEVNKRFITSYLHVHGKLITKIGMETFQHAALQMLREFRVLLQQSPVPLTSNRFLHLLALNMFAIDSTQLKDPELEPSCRSEMQERALVVSLQMFNIILERCVDLLLEHDRQREKIPQQFVQINHDLQVILPAVKVWCDWMLCHSSVWNPPPSCADYRIGPSNDAWSRLAALMNLLEKLNYQKPVLETSLKEGNDMVRLPEDATMCGFTPLMYNSQKPVYVREEVDMEAAQMSVRIGKLLFFGTVFLCGLEPPVLKLQRYENYSEYISVVRTSSHSDSPLTPPELCNEDLLVESFSEDEEEEDPISEAGLDGTPGAEIRSLLDRKVELEKRQRTQELHRQHVQAILQQSVVSVEIEVRPRYLVPDTNCFIDYLDRLQALVRTHGPHTYTLMVPLVVLGELEGLARGGKGPVPIPRVILDQEHMLKVADAARKALEFLHCRNHAVKCLTTHGTVLASSSFTSEDEDRTHDIGPRNDDRILAACLSLCRNASIRDQQASKQVAANCDDHQRAIGATTEPRKIYREVVLLTEDRNLRVKALARDVPVRELPDFLQWAGLG